MARTRTTSSPKPPPRGRRSSREDAEKLVRETDKNNEEASLPPWCIDASGESALGTQDEVDWVKASGWTPLEFLTHAYRNPFQKMENRISAAKAVLDYTHRKLPARIEVSGEVATAGISLDAAALAKLSGEELSALEKLLEKLA